MLYCPFSDGTPGSDVDRIEQGTRLVHIQDGRLALPLRVLWPTHGMSGIHGEDLADEHPIEEHPQGGQPLFHGGLRMLPELVLDESRHVDRFDLGEFHDAMLGAKGGKLPDRLPVGAAGVLVADVGTEEVAQQLAGLGSYGKEGGQGSAGSRGKHLHSRYSIFIFTHDRGHYHA